MKNEYSDIYAMIGRFAVELDPKEVKESMVYEASGGRTIHLTELTEKELSMLRKGLRKALGQPAKESRLSNGCKTGTGMKRKRSTVLALLTKYGIDTKDWDAINAFCQSPRIAGKAFAELSRDELTALAKKMHAILRKGAKRAEETAEEGSMEVEVRVSYKMYVPRTAAKKNRKEYN